VSEFKPSQRKPNQKCVCRVRRGITGKRVFREEKLGKYTDERWVDQNFQGHEIPKRGKKSYSKKRGKKEGGGQWSVLVSNSPLNRGNTGKKSEAFGSREDGGRSNSRTEWSKKSLLKTSERGIWVGGGATGGLLRGKEKI